MKIAATMAPNVMPPKYFILSNVGRTCSRFSGRKSKCAILERKPKVWYRLNRNATHHKNQFDAENIVIPVLEIDLLGVVLHHVINTGSDQQQQAGKNRRR